MSLYSSISSDFGLRAFNDFLFNRKTPTNFVKGILITEEMVVKQKVLELNSLHFLQTSGTAIGTKKTPTYTNIVLSILERMLCTGSCIKQLV